jgi:hypothetical protein
LALKAKHIISDGILPLDALIFLRCYISCSTAIFDSGLSVLMVASATGANVTMLLAGDSPSNDLLIRLPLVVRLHRGHSYFDDLFDIHELCAFNRCHDGLPLLDFGGHVNVVLFGVGFVRCAPTRGLAASASRKTFTTASSLITRAGTRAFNEFCARALFLLQHVLRNLHLHRLQLSNLLLDLLSDNLKLLLVKLLCYLDIFILGDCHLLSFILMLVASFLLLLVGKHLGRLRRFTAAATRIDPAAALLGQVLGRLRQSIPDACPVDAATVATCGLARTCASAALI